MPMWSGKQALLPIKPEVKRTLKAAWVGMAIGIDALIHLGHLRGHPEVGPVRRRPLEDAFGKVAHLSGAAQHTVPSP